eukprot:13431770-Alexandrium_andersonii.AAC.1
MVADPQGDEAVVPEAESVPADGGGPDVGVEPEAVEEEEEQLPPRAQIPPPDELRESDRPG